MEVNVFPPGARGRTWGWGWKGSRIKFMRFLISYVNAQLGAPTLREN